jgi:type IV pilus assembly protein PilA
MKKAFSLIELLVVVAITALLAAFAFPAYRSYTVKSTFARNMPLMTKIASDLTNSYTSRGGSWPSSITVNGVTVNSGSWTRIDATTNLGDIKALVYSPSPDGLGAEVDFVIKGLTGASAPGGGVYVEPLTAATAPATGGYQGFSIGLRDVGGAFKSGCGHPNDASFLSDYIPYAYLPANCKCTNIGVSGGFKYTGTAC